MLQKYFINLPIRFFVVVVVVFASLSVVSGQSAATGQTVCASMLPLLLLVFTRTHNILILCASVHGCSYTYKSNWGEQKAARPTCAVSYAYACAVDDQFPCVCWTRKCTLHHWLCQHCESYRFVGCTHEYTTTFGIQCCVLCVFSARSNCERWPICRWRPKWHDRRNLFWVANSGVCLCV